MHIPLYNLTLNPDDHTGVDYIALVDKPAIMINWHAFNQDNKPATPTVNPYKFKTLDADKHIISGPIMIADKPILRHDEQGMYYALFNADTIMQVVQRFFKQQNTGRVNLMHNTRAIPDDIYMIESFIIDSKRGINTPLGFDHLSDGSWFGSYKVDNTAVWDNYIKTGRFNGFSIEGNFAMVPAGNTDDALVDMIAEEIITFNLL